MDGMFYTNIDREQADVPAKDWPFVGLLVLSIAVGCAVLVGLVILQGMGVPVSLPSALAIDSAAII